MPRLTRTVPKYSLHKASGQAIVRFAGRMHYLGPFGSDESRDAYDRKIAEFLSAGRNADSVNVEAESYCIAHLVKGFLLFASGYYVKDGKATAELNAYRVVLRTLRRLYGTYPVDEFGPRKLKACRQEWLDRGLARSTINRHQRRLVRVFKWGVSEERVLPETWNALRSVEGLRKGRSTAAEPVPVAPVAMDQIVQTMPHLSSIVRDMIRMQLLTGMRPGEVCKLTPAAIDRTNEVWEFVVGGHKTEHHGRERIVFIGPQAKAIIGPYLFRDPNSHCFSPAESMEIHRATRESNRKTPASCGNARGRKRDPRRGPGTRLPRSYFTSGTYGQAVKRACAKAWPAPEEIQKQGKEAIVAWDKQHRWTPNQIRHTRATEIRREYGLEAAQVILGHASADVTQIYAERDMNRAREITRQIG
ncbi:tyrosine-type recombinase/integrase [Crateriforma conspicua]|uniref:Site-specific tyrosine recombinase XerC n=1 Tax=Crateriforma conspicua TaxID=2527996 RepID=A0A5C6FXX2_9PLAN|nr:site-specific integrase [Crateriforma conspicua]TWU66485.1 site-specific tyrosine recombinase XerC [Crateriforma conspicua]